MAVYFILNAASAAVKIGYSDKPQIRKTQLDTATPDELQVIGRIEGDLAVERQWQGQFASLHIRREWFRAEPELLDAIADAVGSEGTGEAGSISHPVEIRAYSQLLVMVKKYGALAFSRKGPLGDSVHELVRDIIRPVSLITGIEGMERISDALEAYADRRWPDLVCATAVGGALDHRFDGIAGWWS